VHILHFWAGRGLLLGWLGVQASNQGEQMVAVVAGAQSKIDPSTLNTISQVVGWTLISVGLLYLAMSFMCLQRLTGGKSMEELDSGFSNLNGQDAESAAEEGRARTNATQSSTNLGAPLNSGSMDEEDIRLLQNTATALGMTVREVRNRFSGAAGAREAQRCFEERKSQLRKPSETPPAPGNSKKNLNEENQQRDRGATANQATAPPVSGRYEAPAFDDDGGRQRNQNDDDLEAQYYAAVAARQ
jgi:hypothetical protein